MGTITKEEDNYIIATLRSVISLGGSKVISLPMDWVKFVERLEKKKLNEVYALMDEVIVVTPEELVDEFKEFLNVWSRLTLKEKEALMNLGRQQIDERVKK